MVQQGFGRAIIGLVFFLLSIPFALGHSATEHVEGVIALVGAGRDTTIIGAFFPETIIVNVGETVTWKLNSDEPHTVTFLGEAARPNFILPAPEDRGLMLNPQAMFPTREPGAPVESYSGKEYINSGFLSPVPDGPDTPPNEEVSVTFTRPGIYEYVCLLHPYMTAEVVVVPETSGPDLAPSQERIDEVAHAEIAPLMNLVEVVRAQSEPLRSEPGPDGTTTWFLRAGGVDANTLDLQAQIYEFFPEVLTIKAGDTVVWGATDIHTITFNPLPPDPEPILPEPQEVGPPLLLLNPAILLSVKPTGIYDPSQYFNSGLIGLATGGGTAWSLTFDEPGSYEYYCALHKELGMEGRIVVLPR